MYLSLVTVAVLKLINVVEKFTLLHFTQKLLQDFIQRMTLC